MSARAEKTISMREPRNDEIIVDFNAERLKAPFLLRFGAMIIDYILIIAFPILGIFLARTFGDDGAKIFKNTFYSTGIIISVLLVVTNFIIFPMFSGQTFGKLLTGLQVVAKDGRAAGYFQILLRHLVGYPLTVLTGGLGFIISFFNAKGRALHDIISGTTVIYGKKRKIVENRNETVTEN